MNEKEYELLGYMKKAYNPKGLYNDQQVEYVYKSALTIMERQIFDEKKRVAIQLMMYNILAPHRSRAANDHVTHYMKMRVMALDDRSEELQSILDKIELILENASDEERAEYVKGIRMDEVSRREDAEELMTKLSQIGLVRWNQQYKKVAKVGNH